MNNDRDKREFTRIPIHPIRTEVTVGGMTIHGEPKNLSMKGLYLPSNLEPSLDANCHVLLRLGEPHNQVCIEVNGKISRLDQTGIGITFTEILGMDSYEHLRNLILYNSTSSDQIEQEFKTHLGLKARSE